MTLAVVGCVCHKRGREYGEQMGCRYVQNQIRCAFDSDTGIAPPAMTIDCHKVCWVCNRSIYDASATLAKSA